MFFLVQATLVGNEDIVYGVPVESDRWEDAVAEATLLLGEGWEIDHTDPSLLGRIEALDVEDDDR